MKATINQLRCFVCSALLAEHIEGQYRVRCSRCKYECATNHYFAEVSAFRCVSCDRLLAEHADSAVFVTCRRCGKGNARVAPGQPCAHPSDNAVKMKKNRT